VAKSVVRASFENAGSAEFAAVHVLRGCRVHTTIYDNKSIIFILPYMGGAKGRRDLRGRVKVTCIFAMGREVVNA
jgi:hypothetical protein